MRDARNFWITFDPQTVEEFIAGMAGPHSADVRMVLSYWDMAASLVENGAIDRKMFQDANGEYIIVYAKVEPFLPKLREMFGNPNMGIHLERLALSLPNAREVIDGTLKRIRTMVARRAESANA
ncbi:MAG TPA: hypothetical protein VHB50_21515 [Bryobacteraceae bacterium]|nr:hypothetical protein [Bryobacteraceae bacterium]